MVVGKEALVSRDTDSFDKTVLDPGPARLRSAAQPDAAGLEARRAAGVRGRSQTERKRWRRQRAQLFLEPPARGAAKCDGYRCVVIHHSGYLRAALLGSILTDAEQFSDRCLRT